MSRQAVLALLRTTEQALNAEHDCVYDQVRFRAEKVLTPKERQTVLLLMALTYLISYTIRELEGNS